MQDHLQVIFEWAKTHSPQTIDNLNEPASDADLEKVEAATGLQLPESLKTLLGKCNGDSQSSWLALLGDGHQLLSCADIIQLYEQGQELAKEYYEPELETVECLREQISDRIIFVKGPVIPTSLHPKWLPFTSMNGDIIRYIDYQPADGGTPGQVIQVDLEGCSHQVLTSSFGALLEQYAQQLHNGDCAVDNQGSINCAKVGLETDADWGMPDWLK